LWNDILSLIQENRIVILTSHSMEECEALCTRLVIMVNGEFKCLGSPQHLKSKFGNGYKLVVRLNDENDKEKLFDFMRVNFPSSVIQETHKNLFEYILPFKNTKLSQIFGKMEKNRETLNIKDYSVSQTTLDQVFVNFAKGQYEDAFIDMDAFNKNPTQARNSIYQTIRQISESDKENANLTLDTNNSKKTVQNNENVELTVGDETGSLSNSLKNSSNQYYYDSNNNISKIDKQSNKIKNKSRISLGDSLNGLL
jgi:ABC-type glutathione transport system ATPase component